MFKLSNAAYCAACNTQVLQVLKSLTFQLQINIHWLTVFTGLLETALVMADVTLLCSPVPWDYQQS